MPAVDRYWIAALFIVIGKNGRELFQRDVRGEFFPFVVVPGFWVERVIVACSYRVIPLPTGKIIPLGMCSGQNLSDAFACAFGFLIHGELIRPDGLIFVNSALDVPAGEIAAVGTGKCAGTEASHRRALPVAVVDHAAFRLWLYAARVFQTKPNSA